MEPFVDFGLFEIIAACAAWRMGKGAWRRATGAFMKRPGDDSPDPPGGRAAERLREFQRERQLPADGPGRTFTPDNAIPATEESQTRSTKRRAAKRPKIVSRKPGK